MPVLSSIHQLFDATHCQAYIHTLRWKRPPTPMSPVPEPRHQSLGDGKCCEDANPEEERRTTSLQPTGAARGSPV